MNRYRTAMEIYSQLTKDYPKEHIVWKEMLSLFFKVILETHSFNIEPITGLYVFTLESIINGAKNTCPQNEIDLLNREIDSFHRRVYDNTISGDFYLLASYNGFQTLEYAFRNISSLHPLMKKLVDDCISITQTLNKMHIHFGYAGCESELSFWFDHANGQNDTIVPRIRIDAIIGRECRWYYAGIPWCDDEQSFSSRLPFSATNEKTFYEKVIETAERNIEKSHECPYCKIGKIRKKKESMFSDQYVFQCSRCGLFDIKKYTFTVKGSA